MPSGAAACPPPHLHCCVCRHDWRRLADLNGTWADVHAALAHAYTRADGDVVSLVLPFWRDAASALLVGCLAGRGNEASAHAGVASCRGDDDEELLLQVPAPRARAATGAHAGLAPAGGGLPDLHTVSSSEDVARLLGACEAWLAGRSSLGRLPERYLGLMQALQASTGVNPLRDAPALPLLLLWVHVLLHAPDEAASAAACQAMYALARPSLDAAVGRHQRQLAARQALGGRGLQEGEADVGEEAGEGREALPPSQLLFQVFMAAVQVGMWRLPSPLPPHPGTRTLPTLWVSTTCRLSSLPPLRPRPAGALRRRPPLEP